MVCLAAEDSCATLSTCKWVEILDSTTMVSESEPNPSYQVYPNPIDGNTISISGITNQVSVTIFNLLGNLVLSSTPLKTGENLDLRDITSGTYLVKILDGDRMTTQTLVKK